MIAGAEWICRGSAPLVNKLAPPSPSPVRSPRGAVAARHATRAARHGTAWLRAARHPCPIRQTREAHWWRAVARRAPHASRVRHPRADRASTTSMSTFGQSASVQKPNKVWRREVLAAVLPRCNDGERAAQHVRARNTSRPIAHTVDGERGRSIHSLDWRGGRVQVHGGA